MHTKIAIFRRLLWRFNESLNKVTGKLIRKWWKNSDSFLRKLSQQRILFESTWRTLSMKKSSMQTFFVVISSLSAFTLYNDLKIPSILWTCHLLSMQSLLTHFTCLRNPNRRLFLFAVKFEISRDTDNVSKHQSCLWREVVKRTDQWEDSARTETQILNLLIRNEFLFRTIFLNSLRPSREFLCYQLGKIN